MIVWQWLSHPAAVAVTAALLHFLWQGTLFALLGVLTVRCLRLATPHARYTAWLTVFAAMAVAPVITLLMLDHQHDVRPLASATAPENDVDDGIDMTDSAITDLTTWPAFVGWTVPTAESSDLVIGSGDVVGTAHPTKSWLSVFDRSSWTTWQPFVLVAWAMGVLLLTLRLIVGTVWLIALSRRLEPVSADLQRRFERLVRRMGLSRPPGVVMSDRVTEPFAWQLLRPLVVLPASWLADVPAEVLEAVVAHELAHIRRHDLWVNLLQRFVETVLFFHPCVWWVSHRVRMERELCCDADAVAATGEAVAYAKALELVAIRRMACAGPQLAVGLGGTRMALLHRVKQVLGVETSAAESGWWSLGLAGVGVTAACWTALTFGTPTVQGDDTPSATVSADSVDAVAQRDDGPKPRGPRDGDRPDGPPPPGRGPREGDRPDGPPPMGRGPRDGERPPGAGPRDGEGPGPRGPRDGERPDGPRGPRDDDFAPGRPGPRPGFGDGPLGGEFVPPAEVMHHMMRAIHELREEVQMLRRELNEMREHRPGQPGPRDDFSPLSRRPGAENRNGPRPEDRPGDRGPGAEDRGGPRPEGRPADRRPGPEDGPRPEGREGDRGPRPVSREGDRPRPPEGRPGEPPRPPEGRGGDRGPRPEGREGPRPEGRGERRPEGEDRPRRTESDRADTEEAPVSAIGFSF